MHAAIYGDNVIAGDAAEVADAAALIIVCELESTGTLLDTADS